MLSVIIINMQTQSLRKLSGFILFSFFLGAFVFGQQVSVSLAKEGIITGQVGKVATVVFKIKNNQNFDCEFEPSLNLPHSWQPIHNKAAFSLGPGQSKVHITSFLVPNFTTFGEYPVVLKVKNTASGRIAGEFTFHVDVPNVYKLAIESIEAPSLAMAGETFEATFSVRNLSNAVHTIQLVPYKCELKEASRISLEPNSSQLVTVTVSTFEELRKVSRAGFRLEAFISGHEEDTHVHTYRHVRVIPTNDADINDIRRLPGYARVSYFGRQNGEEPFQSGYQGELHIQGAIDEAGENEVELRMRGPNQFDLSVYGNYDEYYVGYTSPLFDLRAGDQVFSLSPLTEYSRYGRGLESAFRINPVEIGLFYQRPRFYPDISAEFGAHIKYTFEEENSLSFNMLQKVHLEPNSQSTMMSFLGDFQPLPHTSIIAEYAQGVGESEGRGIYLNLHSNPIKRLNIASTVLYASKDFPGYYNNTWMYSGSVNYYLTKKLNLSFNIHQDERNAARDTLFTVAPYGKRMQAGIGYRFNRKTQLRVYLRNAEREDRFPDTKFHSRDQTARLQLMQQLGKFRFNLSGEYGKSENLLAPLEQREQNLFRSYLDAEFRISNRHSIRGFLQYYNHNSYSIERQEQLVFGVSAYSSLTKSTKLYLQFQNRYELEDYFRDRDLFSIRFSQWIKKKHEFQLTGRYSLLRKTVDNQDLTFAANYTYHFGIPLESKKNYPDVIGKIDNMGAESVKGIVFHLNGKTTVTDAEGNFIFKSVPPGQYYVMMDVTSVGLHEIPDIPTPIVVNVPEEGMIEVRFGLTTGARISGDVSVQEGEKHLISQNRKAAVLGPVMIEISKDGEMHRQLTNAEGYFEFTDIRPGIWNLKVVHNDLYKQFVFDQEVFEVEITPGMHEQITIPVRRKERKIKFMQGLSLSLNDK